MAEDKAVNSSAKKEFTLRKPLRLGSDKKGNPRKVYKVGDKVLLTSDEETRYRKQKLI